MENRRRESSEETAIRGVMGRHVMVEQGEGSASAEEFSVSDGRSGVATSSPRLKGHLTS